MSLLLSSLLHLNVNEIADSLSDLGFPSIHLLSNPQLVMYLGFPLIQSRI